MQLDPLEHATPYNVPNCPSGLRTCDHAVRSNRSIPGGPPTAVQFRALTQVTAISEFTKGRSTRCTVQTVPFHCSAMDFEPLDPTAQHDVAEAQETPRSESCGGATAPAGGAAITKPAAP